MQLHKTDVVEAAAAILDNYGLADLTTRRLARELGVTPGALYWHFANKQQLLGGVADRILTPALAESRALSWGEQITATASGLRDALLSHTDGAELVSASFAAGQSPVLEQILTRLAGAAAAAGLGAEQAQLAARTVAYYVLGFTGDEQSRLQWDAAGADLDEPTGYDPSARFTFGLTLLINGIAAEIAVSRSAARPVARRPSDATRPPDR